MRTPRSLLLLVSGAAVLIPPLPAQENTVPEVRRALPAGTPLHTFSSEVPIMKALPAAAPGAVSSPRTERSPAPTPFPSPPVGNDPGSIRIAPVPSADPGAAAKAQLAVADGFFSRKDPASAVPEYERFLIMVPKDHPDRERALYRLGESQRLMGNGSAAATTFSSILAGSPPGPFCPAAAFRLGELEEATDPAGAASRFDFAAKGTADPSVRQAALWHQAACLEKTGKSREAEALLLTLADPGRGQSVQQKPPGTDAAAKAPLPGPYVVPALLRLASNAAASGRKEDALGFYGKIVSSAAEGEPRAEAGVKSALIQSELGRRDEARKLFATVAGAKDAGPWRGVAALGLMRLSSADGDDDAVLKASQAALEGNSDSKPEILLLRADALRRKGRNNEALALYDSVMRDYPASNAASKAPFGRLLSLHATRSPNLVPEIDQYLLTASDPGDRARAQLLKAEATLAAKDYAGAAVLYSQIDSSALPPSAKPDILYKQTWALLQAGDRDGGTAALSLFLKSYPDDERAPAALAQRAMLRQEAKDFEGALADFSLIEEKYPKAAERELALQQKALLLGQLRRNGEMAETFSRLLADYPKSPAAAQAHYWKGITAFEAKDYPKALEELALARTGDPKQFGERAGLRILLCHYYLGNAPAAAREAAALKPSLIPPEAGRWLGQNSLEAGDKAAAERFLAPLAKEGMPGASDPEIQGMLASALTGQAKFKEAQASAAACLKLARDPASRAKALLVAAEIQRALNNLAAANAQVEEAMLLQPEGPVNAEARILGGDILCSKHDYTAAAKAYMTVALLNGEDGKIAARALERAASAYHRAGNLPEEQRIREELRRKRDHVPVSAVKSP